MLDLGKIRDEIDVTDDEIVRLFQHRMALTAEVAQYKIETGKAVFDAERERQKLEKLTGEGTNAFNTKGIQELFQQIMSISRKRQYQLLTENGGEEMTDYTQVDHLPTHGKRVVFQGVEGAYSFGAMKEFFDDTITSFHVDTWKEAMEAITKGEADYAVLPIENSTAGIVSDIYDLLVEYPHYIVGEQELPVEHVLMALPGAKVVVRRRELRSFSVSMSATINCSSVENRSVRRSIRPLSTIRPLPPNTRSVEDSP